MAITKPNITQQYLGELDTELEIRGHSFVRYADDCSIFAKNEKSANQVLASIKYGALRRE